MNGYRIVGGKLVVPARGSAVTARVKEPSAKVGDILIKHGLIRRTREQLPLIQGLKQYDSLYVEQVGMD